MNSARAAPALGAFVHAQHGTMHGTAAHSTLEALDDLYGFRA